tara:strand:+ start:794 stop:1039 length:246 start_codon:yes stop_codon:yes gene_type:complete
MWGYLLLGVSIGLISLCMGARWSMRFAWRKRKEELEELNRELEQMDELTETLKEQKEEIEDLLKNEFFDYDALFKNKKNID